jgi:hypothetical protein
MTQAIDKKIEDIKERCKRNNNNKQTGFLFASIETPTLAIGVKYEYIEYITRYGPPKDGVFDEKILEALRIELGISNDANTI